MKIDELIELEADVDVGIGMTLRRRLGEIRERFAGKTVLVLANGFDKFIGKRVNSPYLLSRGGWDYDQEANETFEDVLSGLKQSQTKLLIYYPDRKVIALFSGSGTVSRDFTEEGWNDKYY